MLKRLWKPLRNTEGGPFLRQVAILAGGTTAGQALVVLTYPVLTRLYDPSDFGILSVYSSILAFVLVASALRYDLAIPLPADKDRAANLLALCLITVLGVSVATALFVLVMRRPLADWVGAKELASYLWLLPFGVLAGGAYQVLTYWRIRHRDYPGIAKSRLSQGIAQAGGQILFGTMRVGPLGLLAGDALGHLSGGVTLMGPALKKERGQLGKVSSRGIKDAAIRYRRFPFFSAGSALVNSGGLHLPHILFASLYGPRLAGWLALGQRFIGLPVYLASQAVSQVYLAEASRLAQNQRPGLRAMFLVTTRRLVAIGLVPILLLMVSGPRVFGLIFGPEWREAGVYVQILGLMIFLQFVVVPLSQTLNLLERQDLQLVWDVGRLIVVSGSIFGASLLGWSGRQAVGLYGISMFGAYIALYLMGYLATGKAGLDASG